MSTNGETPGKQAIIDVDEQTGVSFERHEERKKDRKYANISAVYLLIMIAIFFWLLFDLWMQQFSIANLLGYPHIERLAVAAFMLPVYALIAGGLGGIVNAMRSIVVWHAERNAFGDRFIWKYIVAPWLGAALALFTYALLQSGVAILSGITPGEITSQPALPTTSQVLATFAIGLLAGYGSHKVFIWLDAQVERIFQVQSAAVIESPQSGKP